MSCNIEQIENMRIHELRDFARSIGVQSPTTMKKEELIEKISEILSEIPSNNSDKDANNDQDLDFYSLLISDNYDYLTTLLEKIQDDSNSSKETEESKEKDNDTILVKRDKLYNENTPYNVYSSDDIVAFNFKLKQNPTPYGEFESSEFSGYLDIHQNGFGIVRGNGFLASSNDVFVPQTFINKYNLKKGDLVRGMIKSIIPNKPMIMYEIISIDGVGKNKLKFEEYPYEKLGQEFYIEKHKFMLSRGERIYISKQNIYDTIDIIQEFAEENPIYVKFFNVKSKPEDHFESNQKVEFINLPFNYDETDFILALDLVLERLKREFENNKSNILVLYNFSEIIRMINAIYQGCYGSIYFDKKTINKILNILNLAKNCNKTSISILCVDSDGVKDDVKNVLCNEFKPIFNTFIEKN